MIGIMAIGLCASSGCSYIAPRATAAQEQSRIANAIERQTVILERIAVAIEGSNTDTNLLIRR